MAKPTQTFVISSYFDTLKAIYIVDLLKASHIFIYINHFTKNIFADGRGSNACTRVYNLWYANIRFVFVSRPCCYHSWLTRIDNNVKTREWVIDGVSYALCESSLVIGLLLALVFIR